MEYKIVNLEDNKTLNTKKVGENGIDMSFIIPQEDSPSIINLMINKLENKLPIRFIFKDSDSNKIENILVFVSNFTYKFTHEYDIEFNGSFKYHKIKIKEKIYEK